MGVSDIVGMRVESLIRAEAGNSSAQTSSYDSIGSAGDVTRDVSPQIDEESLRSTHLTAYTNGPTDRRTGRAQRFPSLF